jgi:rubrerythrin
MPKFVDSDCIAIIGAKRATDPQLAAFFQQLCERAEKFAEMDQEYFAMLRKNRLIRERKPESMTAKEKRLKKRIDVEYGNFYPEFDQLAAKMNDASLLGFALYLERGMCKSWDQLAVKAHVDDKEFAQKLADFRKETLSIIEQFVATSRLKEGVASYIKGVEKWS